MWQNNLGGIREIILIKNVIYPKIFRKFSIVFANNSPAKNFRLLKIWGMMSYDLAELFMQKVERSEN